MAAPGDQQARLKAALDAMRKQQARIERLEARLAGLNEPIAVIGIGCRFPGGADGPARFWDRLREGFDAIGEVPRDRWPIDGYFDADPDAAGCMSTRYGGFLDRIDRFDARFFHISRREAQTMDPQQRLLLEVTWHALEQGGIAPDALAGTATGVFVGLTAIDYGRVIYRDDLSQIDTYTATGNVGNIASGRLSYFFGFRGPSLTVDTACSSSLVSVHLACQSLRTGESEMAIAAGVNLMLTPDNFVAVSRAHMLSPDGRCKAFDRSANGYGRSEGCGVLVLKRLSDARTAGDRVLGVILGSAVRQDGLRSGLTVPNGPAQVAVMRAALHAAGVAPAEVGYLEAHGTGTSLGDPIEFEALGTVYGAGRDRPLIVGSLKTNVGHMESAAGVGGLIKTLLALAHAEVPPHLHFHEPNPEISLDEAGATIPVARTPWPAAYARRIGAVSAFGSSGTIAHVILAAAEPPPTSSAPGSLLVLPLSAKNNRALAELADGYRERLEQAAPEEAADVCYTAAIGRAHFPRRLAVEGHTGAELARKLARGEAAQSGIAREYLAGAAVDWRSFYAGQARARVDAPTYPFQRERCWVDVEAEPRLARSGALSRADAGARASAPRAIRFGVMFFNGTEARDGSDSYRMVLEAARFADRHGFSSVWLPERHFTDFGSLYPNPATIHAALARETRSVRLMAGSVVLPLHNPLRIAEEWAAVDNLSGGRVGMSFASGWNPDDFALAPERYADRREGLFRGIDTLRRLWRGEAVAVKNGAGVDVQLRAYPTPLQPELPLWITAAGNPETFRRAGEAGANLLTHLLDHDPDELAAKIRVYREARAAHGHDPDAGQVTVMLHTFVGDSIDGVHEKVREPYCRYLKDNVQLLKGLATARGSQAQLDNLSGDDLDGFVRFLYDRFFSTRALLGTVDSCLPLVERLEAAGVDEIACLLDFGPSTDDVLAHLPRVAELARAARAGETSAAAPLTGAAYHLEWEHVTAAHADGAAASKSPWATIEDAGAVADAVSSQLRSAGAVVRAVDAAALDAEDTAAAAAASLVSARCHDVLCDWHAQIADDDPQALSRSLMRIARLVRALGHATGRPPRLWFVTRGAFTVADDSAPAHAAQQALAAFVKVLPIEQLPLWGGVIDVDPAAPAGANARLAIEAILNEAREDQCAVRGDRLYAPRLASAADPAEAPDWRCRADAAYLITGGFGGIGIAAAHWLAAKGATRIVLAGRTPLASDDARLGELKRQAVEIEAVAIDVADASAFGSWLGARQARGAAPIAGVIHAAGVWDDRHVAALDEAALDAVLAPKVAGTLTLDRAFAPGALDFFILFSAFSSLLPAERQANYAAANAFADAIAARRRAAGDRAIVVNWGLWADVGFGRTEYGRRAHERLGAMGIGRIASAVGWATLDRYVAANRSGVGVMPIDWARLFQADPNARLSPMLARLAARRIGKTAEASGASGAAAESIAHLPSQQQLAAVRQTLAGIVGEIMRVATDELDPAVRLLDFGLDSLMAVEIKNRVQHDLGVNLPLVQLLEGPSLDGLATQVLAAIKVSSLAPTEGPAGASLEEIEI